MIFFQKVFSFYTFTHSFVQIFRAVAFSSNVVHSLFIYHTEVMLDEYKLVDNLALYNDENRKMRKLSQPPQHSKTLNEHKLKR